MAEEKRARAAHAAANGAASGAAPSAASSATTPAEAGGLDWARPEFQPLPLTLSAQIARGQVRLGALRRLEPGELVPMDTQVGEPSQLVAEGTPIGSGEVVEVGGRLCLRLTRLGVARG